MFGEREFIWGFLYSVHSQHTAGYLYVDRMPCCFCCGSTVLCFDQNQQKVVPMDRIKHNDSRSYWLNKKRNAYVLYQFLGTSIRRLE